MRILAIDMGTGTQDILLFDSEGPAESSLKMVMPSATEIAARRIRRATLEGDRCCSPASPWAAAPATGPWRPT